SAPHGGLLARQQREGPPPADGGRRRARPATRGGRRGRVRGDAGEPPRRGAPGSRAAEPADLRPEHHRRLSRMGGDRGGPPPARRLRPGRPGACRGTPRRGLRGAYLKCAAVDETLVSLPPLETAMFQCCVDRSVWKTWARKSALSIVSRSVSPL